MGPDLAVHPGHEESGWTVTHIASGLAVIRKVSEDAARASAKLLARVDLSADAETLGRDPRLRGFIESVQALAADGVTDLNRAREYVRAFLRERPRGT